MKIIHTSDWHIGRTLYGRKRYEEFEAFLTWLAETIQQYEIDALLVAGDVFDTSAPSNRAQELYYRFLCRMAASSCRHVVVIAGNHDSPSFLNAPKELLKALDVHVVGSVTSDPQDEVLVLRNQQDAPELIVCAVPYLRDRDIRVAEAGESVEDKERKLIDGIGDLRERLETTITNTRMEILRIKNNRITDRVLGQIHEEETLDDLNVNDVFERCLASHQVPEDQRIGLLQTYQETLTSLYEDDLQAE